MEKPTIDFEVLQSKLYEMLKESGWSARLKSYLLSGEFTKVLKELELQANDGKRFTPVLKQVFNAFIECPFDKLKVVILFQDPYNQSHSQKWNKEKHILEISKYPVADGIATSCSNTDKTEITLRYMFDNIASTVYPDQEYERDKDLRRWSNQGILMLNTALTTQIGKIGAHYELWRPFTAFLFDMLNTYKPDLIYCFMGKEAVKWDKQIKSIHKLYASHPASAAYRKDKFWNSGDIWNHVNILCEELHGTKIVW